jgi:hypothetical protein
MIRYSLFILAIAGSAATAIAAIAPAERTALAPANVTVIEKNQAFPVLGILQVEECGTEDCSDE